RGHENGRLGPVRALVLTELWNPRFRKVLRVLPFPDDGPAHLPALVHDALQHVGPALTSSYGLELFERERLVELRLQVLLGHFALRLLRPLLRLPVRFLELVPDVGELLVLLRVLEAMLLKRALRGR